MADPQVIARGVQIELDGVPAVRRRFAFRVPNWHFTARLPSIGEDETMREVDTRTKFGSFGSGLTGDTVRLRASRSDLCLFPADELRNKRA